MIVEDLQGIKREDYVQVGEDVDGSKEAESEELSPEEEMMKMLGFGGFGSTKGKQVESNSTGAAVGAAKKVYALIYLRAIHNY